MDSRTRNGIIIAIVVQLLFIFLIALYYSNNQATELSVFKFLEYSIKSKTFLQLGALATIPNILLFFWQIRNNKVKFSKGVQYVVIAFVICLIILRFL